MNSGQEPKVSFDVPLQKIGCIESNRRKFSIELEAKICDEFKETTGENKVFLAACGDEK